MVRAMVIDYSSAQHVLYQASSPIECTVLDSLITVEGKVLIQYLCVQNLIFTRNEVHNSFYDEGSG